MSRHNGSSAYDPRSRTNFIMAEATSSTSPHPSSSSHQRYRPYNRDEERTARPTRPPDIRSSNQSRPNETWSNSSGRDLSSQKAFFQRRPAYSTPSDIVPNSEKSQSNARSHKSSSANDGNRVQGTSIPRQSTSSQQGRSDGRPAVASFTTAALRQRKKQPREIDLAPTSDESDDDDATIESRWATDERGGAKRRTQGKDPESNPQSLGWMFSSSQDPPAPQGSSGRSSSHKKRKASDLEPTTSAASRSAIPKVKGKQRANATDTRGMAIDIDGDEDDIEEDYPVDKRVSSSSSNYKKLTKMSFSELPGASDILSGKRGTSIRSAHYRPVTSTRDQRDADDIEYFSEDDDSFTLSSSNSKPSRQGPVASVPTASSSKRSSSAKSNKLPPSSSLGSQPLALRPQGSASKSVRSSQVDQGEASNIPKVPLAEIAAHFKRAEHVAHEARIVNSALRKPSQSRSQSQSQPQPQSQGTVRSGTSVSSTKARKGSPDGTPRASGDSYAVARSSGSLSTKPISIGRNSGSNTYDLTPRASQSNPRRRDSSIPKSSSNKPTNPNSASRKRINNRHDDNDVSGDEDTSVTVGASIYYKGQESPKKAGSATVKRDLKTTTTISFSSPAPKRNIPLSSSVEIVPYGSSSKVKAKDRPGAASKDATKTRKKRSETSESEYEEPIAAASSVTKPRPRAKPKVTKSGKTTATQGDIASSTPLALASSGGAEVKRPRPRARPTEGAKAASARGAQMLSQSTSDGEHSDDLARILDKLKEREQDDTEEDERSPGPATQHQWVRNAKFGDIDSEPSEQDDEEHDDDHHEDDLEADGFTGLRCPFCDGALPEKPSQALVAVLAKLCNRADVEVRAKSKNPFAIHLPTVATAVACKRHREERDLIPNGLRNGYPAEGQIDWQDLPRRIDAVCNKDLMLVVLGLRKSTFLEAAKKEWEDAGARKMSNVLNEWSSFEQEIPGYYGQKGFAIIINYWNEFVTTTPVITPDKTAPLDVPVYLRRVLVPETAIRLIQDDRGGCSEREAIRILEESRAYGVAVFGGESGSLPGEPKETKLEKKQRRKEEREEDERREAIMSSQSSEAEAIRRSRDFMATLRLLAA